MNTASNLIGRKFSRLTVVCQHESTTSKRPMWLCRCECGGHSVTSYPSLNNGHTKSCGCLQKEIVGKISTTHGMSTLPEYTAWKHLKQRCYNKNDKSYKSYGGRGISICDRWLSGFENFYTDMGARPSPKHSIDRINNDGNYTPANCRWATKRQQLFNQRLNKKNTTGVPGITLNKKTLSWTVKYGRKYLCSSNDFFEACCVRKSAEVHDQ